MALLVLLVVFLFLNYTATVSSFAAGLGKPTLSTNRRQRETRLKSDGAVTAVYNKEKEYTGPKILRGMPRGDDFDKRIVELAVPAIINFAILPLVGAVDTAFVGQMGDALALAGQGAANQVFSSTFWIISFLPSVVTPLVAQAVGSGDQAEVQDRVGEAVFLGLILGLIGTFFLGKFPDKALSAVLPADAPAMKYAQPYLAIRALTFIPAILSTVGFSCFRGSMDVVTPLKISLLSNVLATSGSDLQLAWNFFKRRTSFGSLLFSLSFPVLFFAFL